MDSNRDIPVYSLGEKLFDIRRLRDCRAVMFDGHHRHDFFEILWFTASSDDVHYIDFQPYAVGNGMIYLMAPGQVHAFDGETPEGYVMVFSLDFFGEVLDEKFRLLFNPFLNDAVEVPEEASTVLQRLVELMLLENAGRRDRAIMISYMKAFLLQLVRLKKDAAFSLDQGGERIGNLFELLEEHFRTERRTGYYAARLGISSKRLNEILKEKLGTTLTRILHGRLVLEAKREIAHGRRNMKEIAFELGFSDQAYFSRFFKVQTGITPESFRSKTHAMQSPGNR